MNVLRISFLVIEAENGLEKDHSIIEFSVWLIIEIATDELDIKKISTKISSVIWERKKGCSLLIFSISIEKLYPKYSTRAVVEDVT